MKQCHIVSRYIVQRNRRRAGTRSTGRHRLHSVRVRTGDGRRYTTPPDGVGCASRSSRGARGVPTRTAYTGGSDARHRLSTSITSSPAATIPTGNGTSAICKGCVDRAIRARPATSPRNVGDEKMPATGRGGAWTGSPIVSGRTDAAEAAVRGRGVRFLPTLIAGRAAHHYAHPAPGCHRSPEQPSRQREPLRWK